MPKQKPQERSAVLVRLPIQMHENLKLEAKIAGTNVHALIIEKLRKSTPDLAQTIPDILKDTLTELKRIANTMDPPECSGS